MTFDLEKFIDNKWQWSLKTFGPSRRTSGLIEHIKKELHEVAVRPDDIEEWVDIILLAIDGASRAGYTGSEIVEAIVAKQLKNLLRKWPDWKTMSEDEAIEHIRVVK